MQIGSVDRVAVFVADELTVRGTWGTDLRGEFRSEHHDSFPIDPTSPYFVSFEDAKNPFVIDTITVDGPSGERWQDVPHALIPIRAGSELIGMLSPEWTTISRSRLILTSC